MQLMPFAEESVIEKLEENIKNISSVTTMLDAGDTPERMLEKLLEGMDVEFTDTMPTQFYCNCDKQRVEKALISIGKAELEEMINDGKDITVNCHFCNHDYVFNVEKLKALQEAAL